MKCSVKFNPNKFTVYSLSQRDLSGLYKVVSSISCKFYNRLSSFINIFYTNPFLLCKYIFYKVTEGTIYDEVAYFTEEVPPLSPVIRRDKTSLSGGVLCFML